MDVGYIVGRLFEVLLGAMGVYIFYGVAKFAAAGNDSGHRRWDNPATWWDKVKTYGGGALIAAFVSALVSHNSGRHAVDHGVVAFVLLAGAVAFGAERGFTRSLPPPRTIAEALRRSDASSSLVYHVPSAEQHLAEAKAFQAKADATMAELLKKVERGEE